MDNALTDFKRNFDQWETQDLEVKAEKSCKQKVLRDRSFNLLMQAAQNFCPSGIPKSV